jgi:hypothetical protein
MGAIPGMTKTPGRWDYPQALGDSEPGKGDFNK